MRIFCWIMLLLFSTVYILSSSSKFMKFITRKRYVLSSPIGSDKYKYGDLYGLSYLRTYKIPTWVDTPTNTSSVNCGAAGKRDIDLYAICDSYLYTFAKDNLEFCRSNKYSYKRTIDDGHLNVHLDKSRI